MPELPEVETTIRFLEKAIKNQKITNLIIKKNKLIKNSDPKSFSNFCVNRKIIDFIRRGKYLIFILDNQTMIISHLRMSGSFKKVKTIENLSTHDHLIFCFINFFIIYNDPRAFGTFHIYFDTDYESKINLGIEPLEKQFDLKLLKELLKNNKQKLKAFLLDQSKIAGIGNIYADEILFASSVLPTRSCKTLTNKEIELIYQNTKLILQKAIANKGTSIQSFSYNSQKGENQNFLLIYKKNICSKCKSEIQRLKIASRTTHFCPRCQK